MRQVGFFFFQCKVPLILHSRLTHKGREYATSMTCVSGYITAYITEWWWHQDGGIKMAAWFPQIPLIRPSVSILSHTGHLFLKNCSVFSWKQKPLPSYPVLIQFLGLVMATIHTEFLENSPGHTQVFVDSFQNSLYFLFYVRGGLLYFTFLVLTTNNTFSLGAWK